jgi:enamine deaminase RidA (YjgF/YER057c/UK114 family)
VHDLGARGAAASWAARSLLDMTEIQLLRPEGLFASPAFSQVAVVPPGATMVYVGGQNAVDQNGELVGGTDAAAQTRQVMANLATALAAAGAGIEHLVSVLVVLVEGVDVQAAYAAAAATLGSAKTPPLVSAAIVSGLGVPGAMVEVSAIAAMPDRAPAQSKLHAQ